MLLVGIGYDTEYPKIDSEGTTEDKATGENVRRKNIEMRWNSVYEAAHVLVGHSPLTAPGSSSFSQIASTEAERDADIA